MEPWFEITVVLGMFSGTSGCVSVIPSTNVAYDGGVNSGGSRAFGVDWVELLIVP